MEPGRALLYSVTVIHRISLKIALTLFLLDLVLDFFLI